MELIEQAVYTSAETDHFAGYQLVGSSPGVSESDARELTTWGPSHDALLEPGPSAVSINFHPLSSGNYCVSRSMPAGSEYSGRGGARVYTQCLIVTPETFRRFANNPFSLLKAALVNGSLRLYQSVPRQLEALRLVGRSGVVDLNLLARLCGNPGERWLATLVQAALGSSAVAIAGGPPAEHLIAGLLNCLPVSCRTAFSFSTGLKYSARRPFRLVALGGDRDEARRVVRLYQPSLLDLSADPPAEFSPTDSWPRLIDRVLRSSNLPFFSSHCSDRDAEWTLEDLPALGLQFMEELDARTQDDDAITLKQPVESVPPPDVSPPKVSPDPPPSAPTRQRAHEAHRQFASQASSAASASADISKPSQHLESGNPAMVEMLERLDDVVFDAISGSSAALQELETVWAKTQAELGEELLAESREQYLRYALTIWETMADSTEARDSQRAIHALDVLCVLFDSV